MTAHLWRHLCFAVLWALVLLVAPLDLFTLDAWLCFLTVLGIGFLASTLHVLKIELVGTAQFQFGTAQLRNCVQIFITRSSLMASWAWAWLLSSVVLQIASVLGVSPLRSSSTPPEVDHERSPLLHQHSAHHFCNADDPSLPFSICPPTPKRVLHLARFTVIAWVLTCGGPYGNESAVKAGGILLTAIGVVVLPLMWSAPQAMISAELSSMMPTNGGSLFWVYRGLGEPAGVVNAYNTLVSSVIDLCLYPNLIVASLPLVMTTRQTYLFKVGILVVITIANAFGMSSIGTASFAVMFLALSAFVAEIPYALADLPTSAQVLATPDPINFPLLFSVLIWSSSGWTSLSGFAGEVVNPTRTFPLGVALAMLLGMITNLIPLFTSYALLPDPSHWSGKAFEVAGRNVGPWMADWVLIGCIGSNLGQILTGMASTSRYIACMANPTERIDGIGRRTLPAALSRLSSAGTPLNALIAQLITISLIVAFDFNVLVQFNLLIDCTRLVMEFVSFMVLKYREPDAPRPFAVPYGLTGAWTLTIVKFFVLFLVVASIACNNPERILFAAIINIALFAAVYYGPIKQQHPTPPSGYSSLA